jgi:hypothetical protein
MTSKLTIEAWIKPTNLSVSYQGIVVKGMASYGYHFMLYQATLNPYARLGGTWQSMSSLGPLSLNKWNYVAWTYDGVNSKLYVNTSTFSIARTGNISYESDDNLYIGNGQYSPEYFNGSIDNIRIYNETIPTSEIRNHYYAGLNSLLVRGSMTAQEYKEIIESAGLSLK